MPRTEEANQVIREEQRTKILAAALIVFAHRGTEATIAEVATAANVSYGLVYRYFASKEVLLVELVGKVLSDSLRSLKRALDVSGTPGERLRLLLTQIANGAREHPEFFLLVQQVLSAEPESAHPYKNGQEKSDRSTHSLEQALRNQVTCDHLQKLAQEQSQTYRAVLRQLIVEGQSTGEIVDADPDQLVNMVAACVVGLAQSTTWQTPEQFQKGFPDAALLLRILMP